MSALTSRVASLFVLSGGVERVNLRSCAVSTASIPATEGTIKINNTLTQRSLNEKARACLLRRRIGFIFQEFNLVDRLSVLRNVLVGRLGYRGRF